MAEPTKLTLDAALDIEGSEDTTRLEVRGHSQQTAPLQEWQDNGGDTLACVSGDGRLLVGDVDLELPAAMVEVSQDVALPSSLPPRGLSVLGRLSGAVAGAITWVAHELQLVGSGGVTGLHSALRAALMLENSGDAGLAELRAGDFEAANRAGSSQAPVGKMTGLRGAVVGEAGSTLDEAVALEASVQQETGGVINTAYGLKVEDVPAAGDGSYAIHTGQGAVHLGDYLELAELSAPSTPGAGLVRLYPKADGRLYAKNDLDTEYDLTAGDSGTLARGGSALIDFGPVGDSQAVATIPVADFMPGGKVVAAISAEATDYNSSDDILIQPLEVKIANKQSGSFDLVVSCLEGVFTHDVRVDYIYLG